MLLVNVGTLSLSIWTVRSCPSSLCLGVVSCALHVANEAQFDAGPVLQEGNGITEGVVHRICNSESGVHYASPSAVAHSSRTASLQPLLLSSSWFLFWRFLAARLLVFIALHTPQQQTAHIK